MGTAEVIIILCMLGTNSLFAAYELALASVSLGRLKMLAEQKRRGAASALAMKSRMEASLAVVQIGITLVGAAAAATGGAAAEESISPLFQQWLKISPGLADFLSILLIVLPLSGITIVIGELVPKTVAIRNSEWVCLKLSRIMKTFAMIVYPAMLLLEWVTKSLVRIFEHGMVSEGGGRYEIGLAELRAQARALRTGRIIGAEQERIILGASTLTHVKVADILVKPQEIVMLTADAPLTEHFITIHLEGYTRFPVTEKAGDPQSIIGYVNLKDVMFLAKTHPENPSLRQILRPLLVIAPDAPIGQAFSRMMGDHVHLSVVKEVDGTVDGIITLEDILEEIVGDIQDEYDRIPRHLVPSGRHWIVGGGLSIAQLREAIKKPDFAPDAKSETPFADWVRDKNDSPIKGGDILMLDGLKILIRKMRRQKVLEAMVSFEDADSL
jgi:putative hemolysin